MWEEQSDPTLSWDPGPLSAWKVQVDFMNCNLIIKACTGISAAAYSIKSDCESLKFVIPQLMEVYHNHHMTITIQRCAWSQGLRAHSSHCKDHRTIKSLLISSPRLHHWSWVSDHITRNVALINTTRLFLSQTLLRQDEEQQCPLV